MTDGGHNECARYGACAPKDLKRAGRQCNLLSQYNRYDNIWIEIRPVHCASMSGRPAIVLLDSSLDTGTAITLPTQPYFHHVDHVL